MKDILSVEFDEKALCVLIYIGNNLIQTFSYEQEKEMAYWVVCFASNSDMMIDFKKY